MFYIDEMFSTVELRRARAKYAANAAYEETLEETGDDNAAQDAYNRVYKRLQAEEQKR